MNFVNEYVVDFVVYMNLLGVLIVCDVMMGGDFDGLQVGVEIFIWDLILEIQEIKVMIVVEDGKFIGVVIENLVLMCFV